MRLFLWLAFNLFGFVCLFGYLFCLFAWLICWFFFFPFLLFIFWLFVSFSVFLMLSFFLVCFCFVSLLKMKWSQINLPWSGRMFLSLLISHGRKRWSCCLQDGFTRDYKSCKLTTWCGIVVLTALWACVCFCAWWVIPLCSNLSSGKGENSHWKICQEIITITKMTDLFWHNNCCVFCNCLVFISC